MAGPEPFPTSSLHIQSSLTTTSGANVTLNNHIVCEWSTSSGILCGSKFQTGNVKAFISHVKAHIVGDVVDTCAWSGCDFPNTNPGMFTRHVLFHPYHSYLKGIGSEVQAKFALPVCQLDGNLGNLIPQQNHELVCLWDEEKCGVVFDNVEEFYSHVRKHVVCSSLQCRWKGCRFEGRDHSRVQEHCRSHTHQRVVACPHCGTLFASNSKFKDHLGRQLSAEESSHTCSICFRAYSTERLLREHIRRHINILKCPQCDMTCNSPSRLQHHIHFKHNDDKPHQCPVCQKRFKTSCCLGEHIETHGPKNIKCSVTGCKYSTKTLKSWQQHMKKVHLPEQKQYCCHICGVCFAEGLQLSTHLKKVHGFRIPPGHSRFRYVTGQDGFRRLQTVRLDDDYIVTPD